MMLLRNLYVRAVVHNIWELIIPPSSDFAFSSIVSSRRHRAAAREIEVRLLAKEDYLHGHSHVDVQGHVLHQVNRRQVLRIIESAFPALEEVAGGHCDS